MEVLREQNMEKFKKISFVLATLFVAAALAIKFTRPEWQKYATYSVIAGVVFFLISLWFERAELKNFFTARSTRHGLNAAVMVLFVLAILGLLNWIVNRHPMKYDTTKNKQFSLSSLTLSSLNNLKKPVKITAFFTEAQDEGNRQKMKDLLDNYKTHSKQLQVQMVDPLKNPRLTQQYGIETNGTTVFEGDGQKTTISTTSEEDVTNALLRITSNKKITLYFLEGHNEANIADFENSGISQIVDEFKKKNYVIQELKDLAATGKIPADCNTLIIAAPTVTLLDHEIKAIQSYIDAGGRVLILDDPQADASLVKLLAANGVTSDDDVVVDDHYFFPLADIAVPLIVPKQGTPLTREFNMQMFFPVVRSLSYKDGGKETITPIAESTQYSWAETDKKQAAYDEGKDKKGPVTVGLTLTKTVDAKDKRSNEARIVVFGDVNFAQNAFVGIPGNKQILLNSVAWLTEQENLIHLPPRDEHSDILMLSSTQLNYTFLLVVVVLPGLVIAAGIAVWIRRKKL